MTEVPIGAAPSLAVARSWMGMPVDGIDGTDVGQVHGLFIDAGAGDLPTWLVVRQGRFRGTLVVVPLRECASGGGRVWVGQEQEAIRRAPVVDPSRPLLREHELTICAHYGIGEQVGRAAEVAGRDDGSTTSVPASP
jgi:PRC-barrel domain